MGRLPLSVRSFQVVVLYRLSRRLRAHFAWFLLCWEWLECLAFGSFDLPRFKTPEKREAPILGTCLLCPVFVLPDKFELAKSDSRIALMVKKDWFFAGPVLSAKHVHQRLPLHGVNRVTTHFSLVGAPRRLQNGGQDVGHMTGRMSFNLRCNAFWPMGNERGRDAALMDIVLEQAKWRIRDICPRIVIALVDLGITRHHVQAVSYCDLLSILRRVGGKSGPSVFCHELRAAAVVRQKT